MGALLFLIEVSGLGTCSPSSGLFGMGQARIENILNLLSPLSLITAQIESTHCILRCMNNSTTIGRRSTGM